jgi:hypothetical protein
MHEVTGRYRTTKVLAIYVAERDNRRQRRGRQIQTETIPKIGSNIRFGLAAQPVGATQALNLSAGVSKLQGLTWPLVELTRHVVQIGLRVHRQVSAFRKVLSQQTVGVLI